VAWGNVDAVLKRITEHHQAGADHVALQVLDWHTDAPDRDKRRLPRSQYRQLAEGLADLGGPSQARAPRSTGG
jgi:hypothetical protein